MAHSKKNDFGLLNRTIILGSCLRQLIIAGLLLLPTTVTSRHRYAVSPCIVGETRFTLQVFRLALLLRPGVRQVPQPLVVGQQCPIPFSVESQLLASPLCLGYTAGSKGADLPFTGATTRESCCDVCHVTLWGLYCDVITITSFPSLSNTLQL